MAVRLSAFFFLIGAVAFGQADPDLRFEVASVRRVEIPANAGGVPVFFPTGGIGTSDPTHIAYRGAWLMNLMTEAFGVRADQITGAAWLKVRSERYDIVANIPEGTTKGQFNAMLENLLRDRFHLRFHMDSKITPVYALRVAKNGPKFKATARRDDAAVPSRPMGDRDAQGFIIVPPGYKGMLSRPVPGEIFTTAQDVSMTDLALSLEQKAERPIVDETGLTGHYDFKIHYEWLRRPTDTGVATEPAPSVFTAVEEQLGLKLESSTHAFPQLIIDSIDREPAEN
jgi:uncharacterized protein (TIGR03435 family)